MSLPMPYFQDDAVTIYHGDCLDVLLRLEPESVDMILTDPPYDIESADLRRVWEAVLPILKPNGHLVWTFNSCRLRVIGDSIILGFTEIRSAVWHKRFCPSPWRFGWSWHWEPILWWMKSDGRPTGLSQWKWPESDVIEINTLPFRSPERLAHHDQKPLALWRKLLGWFTEEADVVLDMFSGSGTTMRAAKDMGRRCIAIEREEKYCAIAAKRMAQAVLPLAEEE